MAPILRISALGLIAVSLSESQTIFSGLPTSLPPTATAATAVASIVASATPSFTLGDPFNIKTFPICAQTCNNQSAVNFPGDLSQIKVLCGPAFRALTAGCEKKTCSADDYTKTQQLAVGVCGSLYSNDTALGSYVTAAIGSATVLVANSTATGSPVAFTGAGHGLEMPVWTMSGVFLLLISSALLLA